MAAKIAFHFCSLSSAFFRASWEFSSSFSRASLFLFSGLSEVALSFLEIAGIRITVSTGAHLVFCSSAAIASEFSKIFLASETAIRAAVT